jgi:hypothetical protein
MLPPIPPVRPSGSAGAEALPLYRVVHVQFFLVGDSHVAIRVVLASGIACQLQEYGRFPWVRSQIQCTASFLQVLT